MSSKKSINSSVFVLLTFLLVCTLMISNVQGAVLSISSASIQSNYQGFNKAWIVSMISDDYTTDSLNAYLTPQDIKDATGGTTTSKEALSINVNTKPNYCTYDFKTNSFSYQDVYTIQPVHIQRFWYTDAIADAKAQCADFSQTGYKLRSDYDPKAGRDSMYTWMVGGLIYYDIYCVKLNEKLGTVAQPINKFIVAQSDWSVTAQGKTPQTATISNSDAGAGRSTKLGDNVYVQWQGNLGTGEDCPDVSNLVGIYSNSNYQGWKFASRDAYNTYSNYISSGLRADLGLYKDGYISEQDFANAYNSKANAVSTEKRDFTYSVLDTSINSGKVKIDLGRNIVFPLFRLIINADYLEIVIPVGKPSVLSVSPVTFTQGLAGTTTVNIKNIGDGRGGFTTRIMSCTNGFSSSTPPIGSTLDAGASASLNFNIVGSSQSTNPTVTGTCTVEMKESITGVTDTKTFSATMQQLQTCTPLSKACGAEGGRDVIKQCNSGGTAYSVIQTCGDKEQCTLTMDGAVCKAIGGGGGTDNSCAWYDIGCHFNKIFGGFFSTLGTLLTIFKVILLVISLLVVFFVSRDITQAKIIKNKKDRIFVYVIAFLVSALIGVALYALLFTALFWITIIVLIVISVVLKFIPSFRRR